ncbi:Abi family protein [Promicromonospora citrea]|uniref:Abi-like protein n=1 Tax=Promicromonospora citrea TaxID=43677 RepID=A0A8H9GN35_9MICO|nr:Abi family protein [Promicromonospora citrea]NNH51511.1 hypothetical protein [Promicromonospora citrea]GGM38649.1 hypothetical protein GCM10010102_37730 [Promicromonospora citrea]
MDRSASQAFQQPAHAFEVYISSARFAPYLGRAAGDADRAFELYQWNSRLTGATHEALGHVEVALRNALDARLRTWNAVQPPAPQHGVASYSSNWLEVPAAPLYGLLNTVRHGRRHSTYLRAARRAAESREARGSGHPRSSAPVTHDDLVANLMFGTWVTLLPDSTAHASRRRAQQTMWQAAIRHAFPYHQDPGVIHFWVSRLHRLRNRVAHHEPLIGVDVLAYHRTMVRLLRAIDPVLGDWFSGASPVPALLRSRPRPRAEATGNGAAGGGTTGGR